ncbi:hypothetical protein CCH79_00002791 [Gambusia affinis]|uniref:PDEase domain-containing protein n=1 Tax=Gambusia affinis TaxID=33528 RepID=A0A315W8S5_GAMAF|nr:hypothetical protein CCH79_00002791 [Gambusia affinis]
MAADDSVELWQKCKGVELSLVTFAPLASFSICSRCDSTTDIIYVIAVNVVQVKMLGRIVTVGRAMIAQGISQPTFGGLESSTWLSRGHNIFSNLSSTEYSDLMQLLKQSILATDLTLYFEYVPLNPLKPQHKAHRQPSGSSQHTARSNLGVVVLANNTPWKRNTFFELVSKGEYNWNVKAHRDMCRSMMMTACDLGAVTKPWEISRKVAELVTSEFFEQGDRERLELKLTPSAIFDRNRKDELPGLQLEWIDGICSPLYETLVKLNPKLQPMVDMIRANRANWEDLNKKRQSGQSVSAHASPYNDDATESKACPADKAGSTPCCCSDSESTPSKMAS